MRHLISMIGAVLLAACTNFTAEPQIVNPPIIFSIAPDGDGFILQVAAQNAEIGFIGYRLFAGSTEADVQNANPNAGSDCGPFSELPIDASFYFVEIKPDSNFVTPGRSNTICAIQASPTSGQFIALRALLFNITSIDTSISSNIILVP